jgi:uncharacterized protein YndB with AHSA1/START domain
VVKSKSHLNPQALPIYEKIGRVSRESVLKGSGRDWDQWIKILDAVGAKMWTHQEIVAFLKKRYKLSPWWQQGVTLGYEIAIGRRIDGRSEKGEYTVTATKSIAASGQTVWKKLISEEGQKYWLQSLSTVSFKPGQTFETEDGFFGEIRTLTAGKKMRLSWQNPDQPEKSYVQVFVVARKGKNTILAFTHDKIKDKRFRENIRQRWRNSLEVMAKLLATEQRPPKKSTRSK